MSPPHISLVLEQKETKGTKLWRRWDGLFEFRLKCPEGAKRRQPGAREERPQPRDSYTKKDGPEVIACGPLWQEQNPQVKRAMLMYSDQAYELREDILARPFADTASLFAETGSPSHFQTQGPGHHGIGLFQRARGDNEVVSPVRLLFHSNVGRFVAKPLRQAE